MWDQYVFDRDITHLTPKAENHFSGESNKNDWMAEEELIHQSDQHRKDKRPFFKVLLLTGPPGTGKVPPSPPPSTPLSCLTSLFPDLNQTTLAHIVANHCGYRAIEMNASDDRSIDALKDIISRSMANNTLYSFTESRENRPNCVILDEIDGMDGRGPIDALVSIIKTPLQFNDSSGGKKKSLKGRIALTRPLICICNDQYSPILKELRAVAKVFPFSAPTEIRLVQRLKAICQQEHLGNLSTTALTALCQSCNLDIRSAINTLQFAAMKCSQLHSSTHNSSAANTQQPQHGKKEKIGTDYSYEVSHILTSMLLSGSKDERQDVFKLWRNIFTIRDHQSATKRLSLLSAVQQDQLRSRD
jgi:DNA polymerase III delta prime subunit